MVRMQTLSEAELGREISDPYAFYLWIRRVMILTHIIVDRPRLEVGFSDEALCRPLLNQLGSPRSLYEKMAALLKKAVPASQKRKLLRQHDFLPEDALVDPRLRFSGLGLAKNLEFQRIDEIIDDFLDLRVLELYEQMRGWRGTPAEYQAAQPMLFDHPHTIYTSYIDFQSALRELRLRPGQRFVDFGMGVGRAAFTLALKHPEVSFVGYEIVKERIELARHVRQLFDFNHLTFIEANMSAEGFQPVEADVYFFYAPAKDIAVILNFLERLSARKDFAVVVINDYGDDKVGFISNFRNKPWLKERPYPGDSRKFKIFDAKSSQ